VQHGVAPLEVVPHRGGQRREVRTQVRVGEDEQAEGIVGDPTMMAAPAPSAITGRR